MTIKNPSCLRKETYKLKTARNSASGKVGVFKESVFLIPLTLTLSHPGEGIVAQQY
jgi:hypothetical protein